MRIAVLGTGSVGAALGTGLVGLGHEVRMGSRTADNPKAMVWADQLGESASVGTFADAASWGAVAVIATSGIVSVEVLTSVASELAGKVVIDVSNPLDFSRGFPPTLSVVNDDSLAEQLQRAVPAARVVKALNTLNADLMLNPGALSAPSDVFIAGDDATAKELVRGLLVEAGWLTENVHDLGAIEAARGVEMWLPLWLRIMGSLGTATFNLHLVR